MPWAPASRAPTFIRRLKLSLYEQGTRVSFRTEILLIDGETHKRLDNLPPLRLLDYASPLVSQVLPLRH